ncbi:MAG: ribosome small subunit-dependent GTPase A [Porphyromonadaceae bacterium]|nr:ribosome small subunit-dependent GTPase A [Porphyromonadaceae bacterium]
MRHGLVIKNTGSWYQVKTDDGTFIECKIKGNFRLKGIRTTNPVAVGDRVNIEENSEGTAFIVSIDSRENYIIRKASNLSKEAHILAANIDQALLLVTVNYPQTNLIFIDRFLATAEAYRVPVRLVFNKTDLYDAGDKELLRGLINLYDYIGYPCSPVSAVTGEGMERLREELRCKVSLLAGNSGVGKSSLINFFLPELHLRTGNISHLYHKGMHTTTFSEMYPLPEGGYLIDTPGVKGFGTIDFAPEEVSHFFPEIFKFSRECRFGNCTHRHEPGCAVLQALEEHRISESRYASYLSIMSDSTAGKYRLGD